jgi:8-oxo-dGTP pyrophosphatase MutT (NUDIX family)
VSTGWLDSYTPQGETETAEVERMRRLAACEPDPWLRSLPVHFTASALVVHPDSARVLLRWHQRQRAWLQVGGHGDPGESDPLRIALREAREETGLTDLVPWPDAAIRHVAMCDVPAGKGEPAHEHADLRYVLATRHPDAARPEDPDAPLRWLTVDEARALVGANNVRYTLDRVALLFPLASGRLTRCLPSSFGRFAPSLLSPGTGAPFGSREGSSLLSPDGTAAFGSREGSAREPGHFEV